MNLSWHFRFYTFCLHSDMQSEVNIYEFSTTLPANCENLWKITFEKGSKRLPQSHCQLFHEESDLPSIPKDFFFHINNLYFLVMLYTLYILLRQLEKCQLNFFKDLCLPKAKKFHFCIIKIRQKATATFIGYNNENVYNEMLKTHNGRLYI